MKKKRGLGCVVFSVAVVAVIGVLISYFFVDYPFAARGLGQEIERAKANKIPLVRGDLNPSPAVDPMNNAGPAMMEIARKSYKEFNSINTESNANTKELIERQELDRLSVAEKYLPAFLEANRKPSYWIDRDYDESITLLFPEFAGYKGFGKALATRARLRANKDDLNGAIEDLKAGFRISEHVSNEPTLIGQLVSIAIYAIEMRAIESVVAAQPTNTKFIEQLRREVVEKSTPPDNFDSALRGEVYMEISLLRNMPRYGGRRGLRKMMDGQEPQVRSDVPIQRSGSPKGIVAQAYMAKCLGYWNHVMETKAWKDRDWGKLGDEMDQYAMKNDISKTFHLSDLMNSILMPVFGQAGKSYVGAEANKRVTRSFLLVMEYRAKNRRFPRDLKEAGAEAEDPMLPGKPLRYQTDGKSVKVWSVGKDGVDDGGERKLNKDMVAMYPQPSPSK